MSTYNYSLYGLNIASEIYSPDLPLADGKPDVTISLASLQHIELPKEKEWGNHVLNNEHVLINIRNTARYLVTGGREIIVDVAPGTTEELVCLFLFGSAFGAILHQKGLLAIHGNGVVIKDEIVIFAGNSGKGKSTLAAAFAQRGFQVLSDDVCAIKITKNGEAVVYPGFPRVKLRADAVDSFNIDCKSLRRVHPSDDKFVLPIAATSNESLPLKKIYILQYHKRDDFLIQSLSAFDKVIALISNIYRPKMVKKMKKEGASFELFSKLSLLTPVSNIFRPQDLGLLDEMIDYVLQDNIS